MRLMYPNITATIPTNPNRLYAIPLLGFLIKVIILLPVQLFLAVLGIAALFMGIINSVQVLFTGNYWDTAYKFYLGLMRLSLKTTFFLQGLTDKYPGFSLDIQDNFSLNIDMPKVPNKLFAFPILGGIARGVLLLPFIIFFYVLNYAATLGAGFYGSFSVLFTGKYPEAIFELVRDSSRLAMATTSYMFGLSDKYPSFDISWNHKNLKIALIIIAVILLLYNLVNGNGNSSPKGY
jgi:hypothetical protein